MAIPKIFEVFESFLNAVEDGEIHSSKDGREPIASDMNICNSDRLEILSSGRRKIG